MEILTENYNKDTAFCGENSNYKSIIFLKVIKNAAATDNTIKKKNKNKHN